MASIEMKTLTLPDGVTRSFNDTVARTALNSKVDKETGKGLSTNDYTTEDKTKVAAAAVAVMVNGTTYQSIDGVVDLGTIGDSSGSDGGVSTPQELGIGYGTSSNTATTTARTATCSGYSLVSGGLVAVYFSTDVAANATLNINGKGAKYIRHKNANIEANVIKAKDTVLFAYNGTYYVLVGIFAATVSDIEWEAISNKPSIINEISFNGVDSAVPDATGLVDMGTLTNYEIEGDASLIVSDFTSSTLHFREKHGYIIVQIPSAQRVFSFTFTLNTFNNADNYLLIDNQSENDVTIHIRGLLYNGVAVNQIRVPDNTIIVPSGKALELSYIANANYGIVSVGDTLKTSLS
ncbi:MAG: hypothetical protein SPL42_01095 [Bacteroidales bacterium]|nr:hypothetical protein [Bacteroidales bacterium]